MQSVPTSTLEVPLGPVILWWVLFLGTILGAVWLVRIIVRAVRALEKRSTVAEEILLLSARVAQQERELAELRGQVQRLTAPTRTTRAEPLEQ